MYYHCRPLKYVEYGKIFPAPLDTKDEYYNRLYQWLSRYCDYCPQVWLSRSHSSITGFNREKRLKSSYCRAKSPGLRNLIKVNADSVLFGFDIIKGFPVSYGHWELLMNSIINTDGFEKQSRKIVKDMNGYVESYVEDNEPFGGEVKDWVDSGCDLSVYLKKYVFVECDQVVVPSLNLKPAKKIICHNERQKKVLRKMGFIEDRIHIKNFKKWDW